MNCEKLTKRRNILNSFFPLAAMCHWHWHLLAQLQVQRKTVATQIEILDSKDTVHSLALHDGRNYLLPGRIVIVGHKLIVIVRVCSL